MPRGPSGAVLEHLHRLFRVGTAGGLSDGQLLERFLSQRDDAGEAAFKALVERHALMVLRICRDVLADWHEAEDASQATFIVLACKASSIRKRHSIASWLFGVAARVAAQAKAKVARRRRHEARNAELEAVNIVKDDRTVDWLELYEEIDRLPEHLRAPWCSSIGKATPNRRPPPSSGVRCERSRTVSHEVRSGCGVASPGVVSLPPPDCGRRRWARGGSVPVPAAWMETTVRAALRTVNYATSAGTISASVATLTEGMLKTMFRTKLKSVVAAVLSVGVLAAGIGLLVHRTAGAPAQEPRAGEAAEGASPQSREGGLTHAGKEQGGELIVRAAELSRRGDDDGLTGMVAIDPKTGKWRSIFKGLA